MSTVNKLILTLTLFLMTGLAEAASVSYYLDRNNALLPDSSYLKVTISDNANGADVDFRVDVLHDAFTSPDFSLTSNFGMQSFYFNYDNTLTVDTGNIVSIDPSAWNVQTSKNADGYGLFQFDLKGNGSTRTETLFFTVANVSGDNVNSYAVNSTGSAGGSGEYFAAHVAGFDYNGTTSAFFAGSSPVPVPAAIWLLSSGLLGLVGFRRRS